MSHVEVTGVSDRHRPVAELPATPRQHSTTEPTPYGRGSVRVQSQRKTITDSILTSLILNPAVRPAPRQVLRLSPTSSNCDADHPLGDNHFSHNELCL